MPRYLYQCPASPEGKQCPPIEAFRVVADRDRPAHCPNCQGEAPRDKIGTMRETQTVIPGHLHAHVDVADTRLRLGKGPWEGLNDRLNRWNGR